MRRYSLGQKGTSFGGALTNIDDPTNPIPQDLRDSAVKMVIFIRPDKTEIEQPAEFADDNDDLSDGAEIIYADTDMNIPSFLDMIGKWKYTVAVKFVNGNYIRSPDYDWFWVV